MKSSFHGRGRGIRLTQSNQFCTTLIQVAQIRKPSMSRLSRLFAIAMGLAAIVIFTGCHGLVPGLAQLNVTVAGGGIGTVTSSPSGISCPGTCTANFQNVSSVTLTAQPNTGFGFGGWTGCTPQTGNSNACSVSATASVTATFTA